jgi:hypothetical protein
MIMKTIIFWGMTPCSHVAIYGRFGGTCCLYLRSESVSPERNRSQKDLKWLLAVSAYTFTSKMEATSSSNTLVNFYQG